MLGGPGRPGEIPEDVVRRIVDESVDGYTPGDIARRLIADGVATARGGRWCPATVRYVIRRYGDSEREIRLPVFPAEPLLDAVQSGDVAESLGVVSRTVARWRRGSQLTVWQADEAACSIGTHPALIWSDWYSA